MLRSQEVTAPTLDPATPPVPSGSAAGSTTDSSAASTTASTTEVVDAESAATVPELEPATQAIIGVALLLVGLIQIPASRFAATKLLDRQRQPAKSFLWIDLVAVFIAFFFGQVVVALIVQWQHPGLKEVSELGTVTALLLTGVGFLVPCAYIVFAALSRPGGLVALGIKGATPGHRLTFSTVRYLSGLPMFMGLGVLSGLLMTWMGQPVEQEVAVMIRDGLYESPWTIILLAAVVVPLLEEILFRGFLLEFISGMFGRVAGVLVSSAVFALAHGTAAALPIFGLAIILSLVKLRTRSLGACWFVHGLHNGGTTFLLWISTLLPVT